MNYKLKDALLSFILVYGDYNALCYDSMVVKKLRTDLNKSLPNLIDNCIKKIEDKGELLCNGWDALEVHEVYNYLGV